MDLSQYFNEEYKHFLSTNRQQVDQKSIIDQLPPDYTAIWDNFSVSTTAVSIFPHIINQYVKNHYHNFLSFYMFIKEVVKFM